jgi:lipoate-protein ligase B
LISLVQLGTVDYATGLRLQQQLVALRKEEKIGDVLLLLEHSPVITLGRNAKSTNVIASPELLAQRGVELFECDRGGDVTFHGPGQIVGYPIFDLRGFARGAADATSTLRRHLGVVEFVRRLEEVLIRTCADFAIPTKRVAGLTGVWTNHNPLSTRAEENDSQNCSLESRDLLSAEVASAADEEASNTGKHGPNTLHANSRSSGYESRSAFGSPFSARDDNSGERRRDPLADTEAKLAAIGVHISRFVTSHGFALNVNTDLSYFNLIIPCGITAKPVTSMNQELGRELDLNTVAESISRNFGVVFHSQILRVNTLDALLGRAIGVPMQPPEELRELHKEDDSTWA